MVRQKKTFLPLKLFNLKQFVTMMKQLNLRILSHVPLDILPCQSQNSSNININTTWSDCLLYNGTYMCLFPGLAPYAMIFCHLCTCLALLYIHPDQFSLFNLHWDEESQMSPKMWFIEPILLFILSIIKMVLMNWLFRHCQLVNKFFNSIIIF